MTDPTTAAGQKCPLCGHEPVTVTPQKYGFPKVEARQQDASAHQHANYDCGGKGHGSDASEVQWCHDCIPHHQQDALALREAASWNKAPMLDTDDDLNRGYKQGWNRAIETAQGLVAALPPSAPAGLDRCDEIVNNGEGEPTECGRTLPCEYHSQPSAPAELDVEREPLDWHRLADALYLAGFGVGGQTIMREDTDRLKAEYARLEQDHP